MRTFTVLPSLWPHILHDGELWEVVKDSGYWIKAIMAKTESWTETGLGPRSDTYKEMNTLQQDV